MAAYQTLYESSVAFGMRKALQVRERMKVCEGEDAGVKEREDAGVKEREDASACVREKMQAREEVGRAWACAGPAGGAGMRRAGRGCSAVVCLVQSAQGRFEQVFEHVQCDQGKHVQCEQV